MQGVVKFFNSEKGFGFITPEIKDGEKKIADVFVHFTGVTDNAELREGDRVSFDIEDGDRGLKAVNVYIEY